MIGRTIGPYEVVAKLGEGGMGEVYRARDSRLGRDVALKIVPAAFAQDPERLARFEREAHLLASLNHPNIATIYGLEPGERLRPSACSGRPEPVEGRPHRAGDRDVRGEASASARAGGGPLPLGGAEAPAPLQEDGSVVLVMELVEGDDLSALIAAGHTTPETGRASARSRDGDSSVTPRGGVAPRGLDIDDARSIAQQVALALEAAHEQGIVHRDLKPANIKVRPDGTVKVLDFGLAKALVPSVESPAVSSSPTITSPAMTQMGTILGTAAYMSPEQARGRPVDRRADIWAFGCVWYEMLTGRRAFDGDEVSDTLAGILRAEPDWTLLPSGLPPTSLAFLKRCLEKDPRRRVRDIGDLRLALEGAFDMPAARDVAGRPRRAWLAPAVVASVLAASLLIAAAVWSARRAPAASDGSVARFEITLAPDVTFSASVVSPLAVTTDGGNILFSGSPGVMQPNRLYQRALGEFEARPFAAAEEEIGSVFLSPDEDWLGFVRVGSSEYLLQKMRVTGGPAVPLARIRSGGHTGASWGRGGSIVYTFDGGISGLTVVADAGGPPRNVTTPPEGERHANPYFLPDGNRILFTRLRAGLPDRVAVLDLATGRHEDLVEGAWPRYAPSGHLLFAREGAIWGAAFDPQRSEIIGEPSPVIADVSDPAAFSYSGNGLLVYRTQARLSETTLVWVERDGSPTRLAQGADQYWLPRLSPDGRRLAVGIESDIWVIDLDRGGRTRVTSGQTSRQFPFAWTRDGRHLTFASPQSNRIMQVAADGTGGPSELLSGPHQQWPTDWAPDDRALVFYVNAPPTGRDLWTLPARPSTTPTLFLSTPFHERAARFSPDGRWLAYVSNESGRDEVYVRPYPGPGAPVAISAGGGTEPVWSRRGNELFYRLDSEVYVSSFATATGRPAGASRRLFASDTLALELGGVGGNASYDVHPDDQRLIMLSGTPTPTDVRVVQNWFAELRRLVPVD